MNTRRTPIPFPILFVLLLSWLVLLPAKLAAEPFAYVTNYYSHNVSVIDTETESVVVTIPVGLYPVGVAISPDATRVYVVNNGYYSGAWGTVSVIDTATNAVIATIPAGQNPKSVAIHPSGSPLYVVTNYGQGKVLVIDTSSLSLTASIPVGANPNCIIIDPSGSRLYVANSGYFSFTHGQDVSVIDTATNTETAIISNLGFPYGLALDPTGTTLYVARPYGSSPNTIAVIDTATNALTDSIPVDASPYGAVVSPDGAHLYVSNFDGGTVSVVDTDINAVTASIAVGMGAYGIDTTSDGTRLYVALYSENKVAIVDTGSETLLYKLAVGSSPAAWGKFITPGATTANQPPTAQCAEPALLPADASCQATLSPESLDGGSYDPDGDPLTFTLSPSGPYSLGLTNVTLTVTDPDGLSDSCETTVSVQDTTPPTLASVAGVRVNNDPGECSASGVELGAPDTSDNCPGVSLDHAPMEPYPWKKTWVQWTAEDSSGNTTSVIQTVTVNDAENPHIQCPSDVELTTNNSDGESFSYTVDSTDNCMVTATDCSMPSGALFPLGTTTVTCVARDGAVPVANQETCQFEVSVVLSTADTPEELIRNLIAEVQRLVADRTLNTGQGNSLISKLTNILDKLLRGQQPAACNQLDAFVNQVTAFVQARILPAEAGQNLINKAKNIRSILGC